MRAAFPGKKRDGPPIRPRAKSPNAQQQLCVGRQTPALHRDRMWTNSRGRWCSSEAATPTLPFANKDVDDDDDKESILRCVFRLDILGKDVEGRGFGMRFCSPDWVG